MCNLPTPLEICPPACYHGLGIDLPTPAVFGLSRHSTTLQGNGPVADPGRDEIRPWHAWKFAHGAEWEIELWFSRST